ncbi:MAG: hypothetical protein JNL10_09455 [Verrucomicrobiales bacterium]|nr:hypothetical protein [Verrucomicrobiales bacterium]
MALGGVLLALWAVVFFPPRPKPVAVSADSQVRILSVESGWGTKVTLTCGSKFEARIRRWLMKAGFKDLAQTEITVPGVQPVFCVLIGFERETPISTSSNNLADRIAVDGTDLLGTQWSSSTLVQGRRHFMLVTSHQPEPVRTNRVLELRFTRTRPVSIPLKPDVAPR